MSQTFESSFVREFLKIRSSLTALALACLICPCAGAGDESKKTQTAQPETGRQMNWQKPTYGTSESSQETTCTVQGKPATKQQYEAVKVYDEGLLLMRSNANEEALQKFKQSISMYDGYAQVHHSLGLCYGKLGNTQEAIKELQKATEQNAQLNESWLLLAGFYQSTNLLQ